MIENNEYCCNIMSAFIDNEEYDLVKYRPDIRSYTFFLHKNGKDQDVMQTLYFCPWCGKELPKDLYDEVEEVLLYEYGISEKDINNEEKIPEEFKTDEWWRKRGL